MSSVLTDFTMVLRVCCLFFFFQAEDGIRDDLVTGVQTCALPIDRKSTRLNSSHQIISYAGFCLKKKKIEKTSPQVASLDDTLFVRAVVVGKPSYLSQTCLPVSQYMPYCS